MRHAAKTIRVKQYPLFLNKFTYLISLLAMLLICRPLFFREEFAGNALETGSTEMFYISLHLAARSLYTILSLSVSFVCEVFCHCQYLYQYHFPKMFCDEEREFALEIWYMTQQFNRKENNMDYVQNSIVHDMDEPAIGMSSAGAEGEAIQGPRKISPRPWLMAPKNLAMSRIVVVPVTAVTAAALLL